MATMTVVGGELVLALGRGERTAGLHGDVRVPLSAVREVAVVRNPVAEVRGLRAPGLAVPGRTKIGTWRRAGGRSFVVARRDVPAVRVALSGARYDELLVSHTAAAELAARIRESAGLPAPVAEERATFSSGGLTLGGTLALPPADPASPGTAPAGTVPAAPGSTGTASVDAASAGTVPGRRRPYPAALIITGSGPLDRDANHPRMPLRISRDLAHALARAGIASFRYDKRGAGESQGSFLAAGLTDNIDDARAALAWLRARPEIDPAAVFVIGHSEGAVIATALGAEPAGGVEPAGNAGSAEPAGNAGSAEPAGSAGGAADTGGAADLAGIVLLSPMAKTGEETLTWQTRQVAGDLPAPVRVILRLLRTDVVAKQAEAVARLKATTTDVARVQGRKTNARWHREFIAFDPGPALRALRAPVLAVTGAADVQVDPADLDAIAAAAGGARTDAGTDAGTDNGTGTGGDAAGRDVTTVRVPELSHLLRRDPDGGGLRTYKQQIRRPTDPGLLSLVTDWITERLPRP
ncbi:serine aminopeptidase domain-containing protein [Planomonospora sp. ID82291]|uniref:serine aminopeptidase domain-containing protein n=1 Tax=Planomonospora sp. ID82291 TaxID=2738136 RepID=UPI001A1813FF|nr:alpha/beta hydrolase [Planomonospora sp. ID82291]MBG0815539.1 alpha/beta hydrolase [Planomonospora sp. ID82291]